METVKITNNVRFEGVLGRMTTTFELNINYLLITKQSCIKISHYNNNLPIAKEIYGTIKRKILCYYLCESKTMLMANELQCFCQRIESSSRAKDIFRSMLNAKINADAMKEQCKVD